MILITRFPSVKFEEALHIEWFKQPENQIKFNESFQKHEKVVKTRIVTENHKMNDLGSGIKEIYY